MIKFKMIIYKKILISFLIAILFSSSIYLEHFGISNILLNSLIGLFSIYLLLTVSKQSLFYIGFFIGILWFWWIGYSFIYYDLIFLIPLVLIAIGLVYGLLFYFTAFYNCLIYRVSTLFLLSFIYPFGFNWFKMELLFINSLFGIQKIDLAIILITIAIFIHYKKFILLLPLLASINYNIPNIEIPNISIDMPQYNIPQDQKWIKSNRNNIINQNLENIDNAISKGYKIIILPETAFPMYLNMDSKTMDILKNKSKQITIITGALEYKNKQFYNATYMFQDTRVTIAHKVVLVPFGEAVPLPQLLRDWINNSFYNGAKDYSIATQATTFDIKSLKFRNAICYEATTDKIFENLDTTYMIAISNNAWFTPSIEPSLQNLLLKYYAKKYNVIIYHNSNMSQNKIIKGY